MYPFEYLYRIIKKDDILYVFIDNVNRNIDTATIQDTISNKISEQTGVDKDSLKIKLYISGRLASGADEINDKSMIFGLSEYSGTEDNEFTYKLVGDVNSSKQMLRVYYKDGVVSITNYSLLEDSLGIKLNYKSEEASQLAKVEQYVAEQQSINSNASEEEVMLPPVLSGDKLLCLHGGEVLLSSIDGKPFCNDSDTFILDSDLRNAKIIGCTNNVAGVAKPCTSITIIPPTALSKVTFNDKRAVMRDHLHSILTDNMVSLMLKQPEEPNLWEILSHKPTDNNGDFEGVLAELMSGIFYLMYDDITSENVCIINTTFENMSNATYANTFPLANLSLDNPLEIVIDKPDENDESINPTILDVLKKHSNGNEFVYKAMTIILDNSIYEYILLIPKVNKRILNQLPKEYRDYGYGKITDLSYTTSRTINDSNNNKHNIGYSNIKTASFRFPAGAKKFLLHIEALSSLSSKGRVNSIESSTYPISYYNVSMDFSNQYSTSFTSYNVIFNSRQEEHLYEYIVNKLDEATSKLEYNAESSSSILPDKSTIQDSNNVVYDEEQEKKNMSDLVYSILTSDSINQVIDESIESYQKFISILEDKENISANSSDYNSNKSGDYYGGIKLNNLVDLLQNANFSRNKIYQDKEKYNQEITDLSENLLAKLIARKIIELVKDNLIPFAVDNGKKTVKIGKILLKDFKKLKFLVSKIPYVAIAFLIVDIIFAIRDIMKDYAEGKILMKEFCEILSFYSNLDSELSTIITSDSINQSVFYKIIEDNIYNLSLYSSNQTSYNSLGFFVNNDLQTPCNYINVHINKEIFDNNIFTIDQFIDSSDSYSEDEDINSNVESDIAVNNSDFENNCNDTEDKGSENNNSDVVVSFVDKIAQLSVFYSLDNLKESSNFHHVKDLITKSSAFTYIETSSFSSIFISELIKQGFYTPLNQQIKKSVIIITDAIEKHSLVYKSQNFVFSRLLTDKKLPNIYSFRLMKEYKVSQLTNHIITELQDIYNVFINSFQDIKTDDFKENVKDHLEYKKVEEFFTAFSKTYQNIFGIPVETNVFDSIKNFVNFFNYNHDKFFNFFYLTETDEGYKIKEKDILKYMKSVCNKFSESINNLNEEKSDYIATLQKYHDYKFKDEKLVKLNSVSDAIDRLHSLIELEYTILSYFHEEVEDSDLKEHVENTISMLHSDMDDFFAKTSGICSFLSGVFDKEPEGSELTQYIRSDITLKEICKNVISAEYSYEYKANMEKLKSSIDKYAVEIPINNAEISGIDNYIDKLYDLYSQIADTINNYVYEEDVDGNKILHIIKHNAYSLDKEFFKELFKSGICMHLDNVLPVKKGSIEFAVDDPKYYPKLMETLFVRFLLSLRNGIKGNATNTNKDMGYLCSYIFDRAYNYLYSEYGIYDFEQIECAKIIRISNILLDNVFVDNIELNTAKADSVEPSVLEHTYQEVIVKKIEEIEEKFNQIKDTVTNPTSFFSTLFDKSKDVARNVIDLKDKDNLFVFDKDIRICADYMVDTVDDIQYIIDVIKGDTAFNYQELETYKNFFGKKSISEVLLESDYKKIYNTIKKTASNYVKVFTTEQIKKTIKSIISLKNIRGLIDPKKIITSGGSYIFQTGLDFVCELIVDKYLQVPALEEYEAKTNAIKYAYTSKRMDTRGALYIPERDLLALPVKVTQSYIMSDFRAAVFGGAAFDNDCFVRGSSTGIFIQDNDTISHNFIDKICSYIYNVPIDNINIKDCIYIDAYKKIIQYMYSYNEDIEGLGELYKTIAAGGALSDIGEATIEASMLQNNNNYNINSHNGKYFKKEYIDDFAIQLKLFGEYNYKYFYSHQELMANDSSAVDGSTTDDLIESNSDIHNELVLLGMLIYDKQWINN